MAKRKAVKRVDRLHSFRAMKLIASALEREPLHHIRAAVNWMDSKLRAAERKQWHDRIKAATKGAKHGN